MSRRDTVVRAIRAHKARRTRVYIWAAEWVRELVGRPLLCWSPPKPPPTVAEIDRAVAVHLAENPNPEPGAVAPATDEETPHVEN
jgi:hypothetical protein